MHILDGFDRQSYIVSPHGTCWEVRREADGSSLVTTSDKSEAIAMARDLAERSAFGQIVVHTGDGLVEYESTCAKRSPRSRLPRGPALP